MIRAIFTTHRIGPGNWGWSSAPGCYYGGHSFTETPLFAFLGMGSFLASVVTVIALSL